MTQLQKQMEQEPWLIKEDDSREVNTKRTFIIFCEDGAVEPAYFELFQSYTVQVSAIGNSKQHHAQIDIATEYFRENDLLELQADGSETLKIDEGAQVWCVYDRDKNENDQKDTAFNDSILTAERKGIRVAWSNDDFELWVLLHFEEVNPEDTEYCHRKKYYSRLTEILKEREPAESFVHNDQFDYYTSMKTKRRFLGCTYQYMKGQIMIAIKRANKLEEYHSRSLKPLHLQSPCTKVHHLVLELIRDKELE